MEYSDFCIFAKFETRNIPYFPCIYIASKSNFYFCEKLVPTKISIEYSIMITVCRALVKTVNKKSINNDLRSPVPIAIIICLFLKLLPKLINRVQRHSESHQWFFVIKVKFIWKFGHGVPKPIIKAENRQKLLNTGFSSRMVHS